VAERAAPTRRIRRDLKSLRQRDLNFDPARLPELARSDPWHVDDYCRELPAEPPGPPRAVGSFAIATRLMRDYEFADPRVVTAFYEADRPLAGRDMLLQIHFAGLRFRVGVRVARVIDETRAIGWHDVAVWGWAYRTLEGHLERGQMDYEVWKWLDTGRVEFRIHAVSEIAEIANPLVRLGFRLFGRREQVKFARECGERLARLTQEALDARRAAPAARVIDGVVASPAPSDD
jgi:uncharacterized protein (UPF0548 family)